MTWVIGKQASELEAIFEQQSQALKQDSALKIERTVHYALVECDTDLKRIPLDAKSMGFAVQPSEDDPSAIDERVIFSLLLATGTLSQNSIDVPADSRLDPAVVLEEAEAQGLNVRVMLPDSPSTIESVVGYSDLLERYAMLWLANERANFTLTPLDGYLEYKMQAALGYQAPQITSNEEMQELFTSPLVPEVMDYIKQRLDVVIQEALGGDEFFAEQVKRVGEALHLKRVELMQARRRMIEEELDARTPVPNLIRLTSKLTGLEIPDAAGLVFELKHSIHTVLDKYIPKDDSEPVNQVGAAQLELAGKIVAMLGAGFGGQEALVKAWDGISAATQLKHKFDLDRGTHEPSDFAKGLSSFAGVEPKVGALAAGEFVAFFGGLLKAGGAIPEIGLEKPVPVLAAPANTSNIIAIG